jgi:hypothetical protein
MQHPNSSSAQKQAKGHTGQGPGSDNHKQIKTGPHRILADIASFDRSQYQGSKRCESIRPLSGLRQGEQHWERWDEAPDHKGDPDLHAFQPGIDVGVFDHSQLVMHHGLVPAFLVRGEVIDDMLQKGPLKPLFW